VQRLYAPRGGTGFAIAHTWGGYVRISLYLSQVEVLHERLQIDAVALSSQGAIAYTEGANVFLEGREAPIGAHLDKVNVVAFFADGTRLASAGGDGTVRIWSLDGEELARIEVSATKLAWHPSGKYLVTGNEPSVRVWSLDPPS